MNRQSFVDQAIIQSLLDIDFYKFTMGQAAFHRHPNVPVVYGFNNRTTSVRLADHIDIGELREQLDHAMTLSIGNSELHFLRGTNEYGERMFAEDYLQFLAGLRLPEYSLEEDEANGTFILQFSGPWAESIYWETIALSIINELYYRSLLKGLSNFEQDCIYAEGKIRLAAKIKLLRGYPEISFSDFGTRRRFSRDWQEYAVEAMAEELLGQMLGTSNTLLAMKLNLLPMGTSAHEVYMVYTGIYHDDDDSIRASHNRFLRDWEDDYGVSLSVALTDTFGSDFFFRDMTQAQAERWTGLRQDSGDPFVFGDRAIAFYEGHGIDPREKLIVFSDGLDVKPIIKLHEHFSGRIKTSFGWGTTLTNDMGLGTLSLVVKAIKANGHGTVKLSDNMAKALGSPEDIERFKRIFGHTITTSDECIV